MPSKTTDALQQARALLEQRLRELDDERRQVERALGQITEGATTGPRRRGRPRKSTTGRRGRPRGSKRGKQALAAVKANPGITASEIAKKIGIKPNYVYRLMADLSKEGTVRKDGRGYHAV
jgi:predicted HTH transcriptional regulator